MPFGLDITTLLIILAGGIAVIVLGVGITMSVIMKPKVRLKQRMESIGSIASSGSVSAKAESRHPTNQGRGGNTKHALTPRS